jgi:hypothetical protein
MAIKMISKNSKVLKTQSMKEIIDVVLIVMDRY